MCGVTSPSPNSHQPYELARKVKETPSLKELVGFFDIDWVCWQDDGELSERGVNHLFTSSSLQAQFNWTLSSVLVALPWVSFFLFKQGSFPHFGMVKGPKECYCLYCIVYHLE